MKKQRLIFAMLVFLATGSVMAQTQYQSLVDEKHPETKMLRGIISKDIIKNDTAYKWYSDNQRIYAHPDTAIISAFERNKDSVNFIVFGGTWCEDSQFILPKFFILQEKAGISDERITFFAVDRQKKTIGNMSSALGIINVPTIIVMKNGNEKGRVVEYGKTGKWDRELADILNQ